MLLFRCVHSMIFSHSEVILRVMRKNFNAKKLKRLIKFEKNKFKNSHNLLRYLSPSSDVISCSLEVFYNNYHQVSLKCSHISAKNLNILGLDFTKIFIIWLGKSFKVKNLSEMIKTKCSIFANGIHQLEKKLVFKSH